MAKEINIQTIGTPESYKRYLMEILVSLAASDTSIETSSPMQIAEKWGVSASQALSDFAKAKNVLAAVKMFISKAVDDNWNNIK